MTRSLEKRSTLISSLFWIFPYQFFQVEFFSSVNSEESDIFWDLPDFVEHEEYYRFSEWFVIFMNEWCSTWWFRSWFQWISIRDLREMISKFFETLFSRWTTKHDEICLKESWMNDNVQRFEKERRIEWCLIFNKEDEICLLIDLIDSLANNEDFLSLNLSIDLILEQFTKILYHDSCNQVNFAYLMSNK